MKDAVCLRCDWTGQERGPECPNCGAPLFRPAQPVSSKKASRKRASSEARMRDERDEEIPFYVQDQDEPARKAGRWAGVLVVLLLLALTVVAFIRFTPEPEPEPSEGDLDGALVFATQESFGWSRLHVMDLRTGSVVAGPQVFRPDRLVAVPDSSSGTIGTVAAFDGSRQAGWADLLSRARQPEVPLVSSAYVAWSSDGRRVFSASIDRGKCGPVRLQRVLPSGDVARFRSARVCGSLEGLSVGGSTPFVTVRQSHGWSIWEVGWEGGGFTRSALDGYRLLSASNDGVLAVVKMRSAASRPTPGGLEFFSLGDGDPRAAGTGAAPLITEEVLGWTEGSDAAYVLGSFADIRGVYLIPVPSDEMRLPPRLILETQAEQVGMAQTDDGVVLLSAGGQFLVYEGGSLSSLDLPDETPRPVGPMLWLPALPYSGE